LISITMIFILTDNYKSWCFSLG